jgi:hypothetical protein
MRHYLVVAHQTLGSPQLLETLRVLLAEGPCTFHLVVPELHGHGFTWSEGEVRVAAERHLEEARLRFTVEGLAVTGEVGDPSPVDAVDAVVRREGADAFAAVVVSTLPRKISKWLGIDAPQRIERRTGRPVIHVVGDPVAVSEPDPSA